MRVLGVGFRMSLGRAIPPILANLSTLGVTVAKTSNGKTAAPQTVNILNPDFNLEAEINALPETVRAEIASGRLKAERTDVTYTEDATKKKHLQYFLRLVPSAKLPDETEQSAETRLSLAQQFIVTDVADQVKFMLAGADGAKRLDIRSQIVTAVEGAGKAIEKATAAVDALKSVLTPEQYAAMMSALDAAKTAAAAKE